MDIAIIGGADGPTKIFLTSNVTPLIAIFTLVCIAVVGIIIFTIKNRKK